MCRFDTIVCPRSCYIVSWPMVLELIENHTSPTRSLHQWPEIEQYETEQPEVSCHSVFTPSLEAAVLTWVGTSSGRVFLVHSLWLFKQAKQWSQPAPKGKTGLKELLQVWSFLLMQWPGTTRQCLFILE